MRFDGLELAPPEDFAVEEASLTLRAPAGPREPRMLQKQLPVRANLIVHRRRVGDAATLDLLAAEVTAELVSSVVGLEGLHRDPITYADGASGFVVGYEMPMREVAALRQFHALRLDDGVFTDVTLTVDSLTLNDRAKERWYQVLAATRLA